MARKISPLKARRIYKGRLFLGLVLKPLRLFCLNCDKYIPSDIEWLCGHCNEENRATRIYSFLNKCRVCKRPPKAFICPHCSTMNYLDKEEIATHPARSLSVPTALPSLDEARARERIEKRERHTDRKEDIERKIEIAKLNADLARHKASAEFAKEKTAMEKLEKSFSAHDAHVMGIKTIVKRARAAKAEEFKDDPKGLEDAYDSIDDWAAREAR